MVNAEMDNGDLKTFRETVKQSSKRYHLDGRSKADDCISDYNPPIKMGKSNSLPITPQKSAAAMEDPLTPTANLKMLVSAAVRIEDEVGQQTRELFQDDEDDYFLEDSCSTVSDSVDEKQDDPIMGHGRKPPCDSFSNSRKLKSLGLLCKKFLSKYPDGSEGAVINLHEVAKELKVERRRIYDIVNVLESLEYVTKKGKNTYTWHGSCRLLPTLRKLKGLAAMIYGDLADDFQSKQSSEQVGVSSPDNASTVHPEHEIKVNEDEDQELSSPKTKQDESICRRRNKSLGIFCQKLIMLFMVSKSHIIALDEAAKEVIEVDEVRTERNNKTKVRRLYDIANILSSMGLIEKTPTYFGSRKAAFKWVGVELDSLEPDTEEFNRENEFVTTKHSLFSQPSSADAKSKQCSISSLRKLETRSYSASNIEIKKRQKMPRTKSAATILSRKRPSTEGLSEKEIKSNRLVNTHESAVKRSTNHGSKLDESAIDESPSVSHPIIDGGDVDGNRSAENVTTRMESPIRKSRIENEEVSPNERYFREEVRRLQQRFPEKMQNTDGLFQLLKAGNELQESCGEEKGRRCNLLKRIGERNDSIVPSNLDSTKVDGILERAPTPKTTASLTDRNISMSCFRVIMDQLRSKEASSGPRHASQTSPTDSLTVDSRRPNCGSQNISGTDIRVNPPWNCYPYHVSPAKEKASIGVQVSLLEGVSPLKPLNSPFNSPTGRKRGFENSYLGTSQDVSAGQAPVSNSSSIGPLKIPVLSNNSSGGTTVSKCDIRATNSYFLVGFKTPKKPGQVADTVSGSSRLKGVPLQLAANDSNAMAISSSNLQSAPKNVTNDSVIRMVPIPPTPFEMGEDKENWEHAQSSMKGQQKKPALASPAARIILPLQVLNGESQRFTSPVLLPKIKGEMYNEETPIRTDPTDSIRTKNQRKLHKFPAADM